MGRALPETRAQRGMIMVRSMMLAPRMLPTERAACFLTIAVMVVTSSGREVPTAMMVTPMTRSETPANRANSLPLSTRSLAPRAISAAPTASRPRSLGRLPSTACPPPPAGAETRLIWRMVTAM